MKTIFAKATGGGAAPPRSTLHIRRFPKTLSEDTSIRFAPCWYNAEAHEAFPRGMCRPSHDADAKKQTVFVLLCPHRLPLDPSSSLLVRGEAIVPFELEQRADAETRYMRIDPHHACAHQLHTPLFSNAPAFDQQGMAHQEVPM